MNFIAIDFETANSNRNSPCEIGIVKVENLLSKGQEIELLSENQFIEMIQN